MPSLKQLTCTIDVGTHNEPLTEFSTTYRDGFVETFVAVQSRPSPFSIHLTSHGYIAPGLAMFVYIDGVPQCNRNRQGLIVPKANSGPEETEVDIRVRQKEVRIDNDRFIARDWTFEILNIAAADADTSNMTENTLDAIGTMEVVVLRCRDDTEQAPINYTVPDKKAISGPSLKPQTQAKSRLTNKNRKVVPSVVIDNESSVGGLMGLFDGTSDSKQMTRDQDFQFGFDGAQDEPNDAHWGYEKTGPTTGVYHPDRRRERPLSQQHQPFGNQRRVAPALLPPRQAAGAFDVRSYALPPPPAPTTNIGQGQPGLAPYQYPYGTETHVRQPQDVVGYTRYYDLARQAYMEQITRIAEPPHYPAPQQPEMFHHGQHSFPHQCYSYYYPPYQPPYHGEAYPAGLHHHQALSHHHVGNALQPNDEADEGNNGIHHNSIVVNGPMVNGPATLKPSASNHQSTHDANQNNGGGWGDGNDAVPKLEVPTVEAPAIVGNWDNSKDIKEAVEPPAVIGAWDNNQNTQENGRNGAGPSSGKKQEKSMAYLAPFAKPKDRGSGAQNGAVLSKAVDPDRPFIKSYWKDWNQNDRSASADPNTGKKRSQSAYVVGEEPLVVVPTKVAEEKQLSHQVQAGKGALYHHRAEKAEHMDTMENPYAVFVFKYRSLAKLRTILQDDSLRPSRGTFKQRLEAQTKEEVIAQMMKAMKKRLKYNSGSSLDPGSDTVITESDSDTANKDGNGQGHDKNVVAQPSGDAKNSNGGNGRKSSGQKKPAVGDNKKRGNGGQPKDEDIKW